MTTKKTIGMKKAPAKKTIGMKKSPAKTKAGYGVSGGWPTYGSRSQLSTGWRGKDVGKPIRITKKDIAAQKRQVDWWEDPVRGSKLPGTKPKSKTGISRISQHQFGLGGASKAQPKHKISAASKKQFGYRGKSK